MKPFLEKEKGKWSLEHSLMIDDEARMKMKPDLENFKSSTLQLCYKEFRRPGFSHKIWFIRDSQSNWVINFNDEGDGKYLVKIHEHNENP